MARFTDLPNDVIARIFTLLSPLPTLVNGSLSHASNAFSLAQCSKHLFQLFRQTLLAVIDARQYSNEPVSPYCPGSEVRDPYHLSSLVRLAGPYLRQVMIPEYEESEEFSQWPLLKQLQNCLNLETLGFHDPLRPGFCLKRLLSRVPRLRIVSPCNWTLRHIGHQALELELVNVPPTSTRDVLTMLSKCTRLVTFNIAFAQSHDPTFIPLLVRTLAVSATSVMNVQYRCTDAPLPVQPQHLSSSLSRPALLSALRVDADPATRDIVQAFSPLFDGNTLVTTVYSSATFADFRGMTGVIRSVGIHGTVQNLEEVMITRKEEASHIVKHSPRLRVVEIGEDAKDLESICKVLEGIPLEKVTVPGDLLKNGIACGKGLARVKEIVITELGRDEDIWTLVTSLPGLLRSLRRKGSSSSVGVIHVEGCLQVLDGIWQYERIRGYGVLRSLLWEMERLYEDTAVEFCGLREGIRRLVEERDRSMVIDEV